jgi:class 3 adenylate cyclase/ActR/RegA family two-component response regulator
MLANSAAGDAELERRTRLVHIRQSLEAPVRAVLGYQEILLQQAREFALGPALEDLDRMLTAARALDALVNRLLTPDAALNPAWGADLQGIAGFEAKVRHDLRTPLNAIIGYGEMLLEDLADLDAETLRPDLQKILTEARDLLSLTDSIVSFSRFQTDQTVRSGADAIAANLVRAIRPHPDEANAQEAGRLLVVDDNASNRDLLCRQLIHEGHAVTVAESGLRALELLERGAFDLILLDLLMPDMNGFEVLSRIKADKRWQAIPVIMISGLQETEAVARCIEAGADDYLSKPFNSVLLRARIYASLERWRWRTRELAYLREIEAEKERADSLLRNILPAQIISRLNGGETVIADRFEDATILFADLVGFTPAAAHIPPARIVQHLNHIFSSFDALASRLGIEKIKTIGDAYMAASGLPNPCPDHAEVMAELALGMIEMLQHLEEGDPSFAIRIGIHTGPVVAGIIGQHKFIYDVWGDTVNVASRLESHGLPNRIQVSGITRRRLAHRFAFEPRGSITLKGRGRMKTFLLKGIG